MITPYKMWHAGTAAKKERTNLSWFEITNSDEWDEFIEKNKLSDILIGYFRQGFEGKPYTEAHTQRAKDEANGTMPFGQYKNWELEKVPMTYLIWCSEQEWIDKWPTLKAYLTKIQETVVEEKQGRESVLSELDELKKTLQAYDGH